MHVRLVSLCVVFAVAGAFSSVASAAEEAAPEKSEAKADKTDDTTSTEPKVSVEAKDTKVKEVLDSLARQSKEKIILESTVKGTVAALSLKNVPLESALGAVCKSTKLEWRKIYIAPDSKLLEQPDRFAATVRLMSGLSFPDMVLAGSSTDRVSVHIEDKKAVTDTAESATKTLGMAKVYLITNDAAVAAKAIASGKEDTKNQAIDKYTQISKDQMDIFMEMTPEEREQALLASLNLMDQADPRYMSTVMQTLMNSDPENLRRMLEKQTQVMFDMSQEERRAILKLNMQIASMIPPEQLKLLQEDSIAVMEELKASGDLPQAP